jgi:hypothetical protein
MEITLNSLLAVCGGISCIAAAVNWIAKAVKAARAPDQKQNERIKALEDKTKEYDTFFAADKKRLVRLEEGNRITQRALLALLSHGIDGNDTQAMREAKKELQDFLIKS